MKKGGTWTFGKEFELSNRFNIEEGRKKSIDGSGPTEVKSLVYNYNKMLYLLVEEFLLEKIYGSMIYEYYVDEEEEDEQKGNHFHISYNNNLPSYKFYIILYVILQTKFRNLLCQYKFRNTANKWARNQLISPSYYHSIGSREYYIITPNLNNKKKTLEIRLSEYSVVNDLIVFLITKRLYEKYYETLQKIPENELCKITYKYVVKYESDETINNCYNLYYFLSNIDKRIKEYYCHEDFERIHQVLTFLYDKTELEYYYRLFMSLGYKISNKEYNKALEELEKNIDKILISLTYVYSINNYSRSYMKDKIFSILKPLFKNRKLKYHAQRVILSFI